MKWLLLSVLFLVGAAPVARISGIDESSVIEPGDPLEFYADPLTTSERCKWQVSPAVSKTGKPTHKISDDRKTLVLFSRAGVYTITLYVWNEDDLAQTSRIVTIGAEPPPGPPPPPTQPPPSTQLGIIPIVKAAAKLNVPAAERPVGRLLADAYREGAKKIADGSWPVEFALLNQKEVNRAIPGYKVESWRPVFKEISDILATAHQSGKFETKKDYVAAWSEISLAFWGVAE